MVTSLNYRLTRYCGPGTLVLTSAAKPGGGLTAAERARRERTGLWQVSVSPRSTERRLTVSATLKLSHKAIGVEVRRGTFDVLVDGKRVGSVEMNNTIETPVEPGRHTLQVRNGRNSSRTQTFDAAEGEVIAFRCTGKRFLPLFLASFVVPSLALKLRQE
jgi:hypothetical protein